jgi:hypothetical protein
MLGPQSLILVSSTSGAYKNLKKPGWDKIDATILAGKESDSQASGKAVNFLW